MNKHTPGPWAINEITRQYSGKLEIQSGDTHIASVTVGKKGITPEQEANAKLIAAAPELFDALERCLSYLADLNGSEWIKGDGAGELDMKQRANALQRIAYSTTQKARGEA